MPRPTPLQRCIDNLKEEMQNIFMQELAKTNRRIESLAPASNLPPINSPQRNLDYVREPNVSAIMKAKIAAANAAIPDCAPKYVQFHADVTPKKLNSDAKDCLEKLMGLKMGPDYGRMVWSKNPREASFASCEAVIRAASVPPDFVVFRQSANLWCIRELVEQKHKTIVRALNDTNADLAAGTQPESETIPNTCTALIDTSTADVRPTAVQVELTEIVETRAEATRSASPDLGASASISREMVRRGVRGIGRGRGLGRGRGARRGQAQVRSMRGGRPRARGRRPLLRRNSCDSTK